MEFIIFGTQVLTKSYYNKPVCFKILKHIFVRYFIILNYEYITVVMCLKMILLWLVSHGSNNNIYIYINMKTQIKVVYFCFINNKNAIIYNE